MDKKLNAKHEKNKIENTPSIISNAPSSLPWYCAVEACKRSGQPWVMATVLQAKGSTPRNAGTKMLITAERNFDTIGGGRLEYEVIDRARKMLRTGEASQHIERFPLAMKTNQCCGGSVSILFESFSQPKTTINLFGAGHVAKALTKILADLDVHVHWIDNRAEEFPESVAANTRICLEEDPVDFVRKMGTGEFAVILTHQHSLDYQLLEALLDRKDCAFIGLIGSQTKAARFRKRLHSASFSQEEIESYYCPIGLEQVSGKEPMEVAVSIAGQIIEQYQKKSAAETHEQQQISWQEMKQHIEEKML